MVSPTLLLPFVLPFLLGGMAGHPHNPKALILHGAAGKTTVTYFTVPFNAEHLDDLPEGFEWHVGFAALETEVPLRIGGEVVPPARYKLGVVRGATDEEWSVLLEPFELWRAKAQAQRNRDPDAAQRAQAAVVTLRTGLKEKGIPERIVAPTAAFAAGEAEHLELTVVFSGYDTTERFSTEAAGGMRMNLRLDFGGLHREVTIEEQFTKKE